MAAGRVYMVDVLRLGRPVLARGFLTGAFLADVVGLCLSRYPAQIT